MTIIFTTLQHHAGGTRTNIRKELLEGFVQELDASGAVLVLPRVERVLTSSLGADVNETLRRPCPPVPLRRRFSGFLSMYAAFCARRFSRFASSHCRQYPFDLSWPFHMTWHSTHVPFETKRSQSCPCLHGFHTAEEAELALVYASHAANAASAPTGSSWMR
jgi:hypothetical protein